MSKGAEKFTWAVRSDDGRTSAAWMAILEKNGEVYLGPCETIGEGGKISLHRKKGEEPVWIALLPQTEAERNGGLKVPHARLVSKWPVPNERVWGIQPANVVLNFPESELRGDVTIPSKHAKNVEWVQSAGPGMKTQIVFYIIDHDKMSNEPDPDAELEVDVDLRDDRIAGYTSPEPIHTLDNGEVAVRVCRFDMPVVEDEAEWIARMKKSANTYDWRPGHRSYDYADQPGCWQYDLAVENPKPEHWECPFCGRSEAHSSSEMFPDEVCESCAEGWILDVGLAAQDLVGSLITGEPRSLSEDDLHTIAQWLSLTTFLNMLLRDDVPWGFRHHLRKMYDSPERLPHGCCILMMFAAPDLQPVENTFSVRFHLFKRDKPHQRNFIACGKIGGLVFVLTALPVAEDHRPYRVADEEEMICLVPRIIGEGAAWPPERVMPLDAFERMVHGELPNADMVAWETKQHVAEGFFDNIPQ